MPFEELKEKQRFMWGAGPFERIEPNLGAMHRATVERLGPRPGERGSTSAAGPAAPPSWPPRPAPT